MKSVYSSIYLNSVSQKICYDLEDRAKLDVNWTNVWCVVDDYLMAPVRRQVYRQVADRLYAKLDTRTGSD